MSLCQCVRRRDACRSARPSSNSCPALLRGQSKPGISGCETQMATVKKFVIKAGAGAKLRKTHWKLVGSGAIELIHLLDRGGALRALAQEAQQGVPQALQHGGRQQRHVLPCDLQQVGPQDAADLHKTLRQAGPWATPKAEAVTWTTVPYNSLSGL